MAKTSKQASVALWPTFRMKLTSTMLSLLLRSPFHGRVSETLLLLTFRGRKSGKKYAFPVGYIRDGENVLIVLTPKKRVWWKNFRDGASVIVYVQGKKRQGEASVFHDDAEMVAQGISTFLHANPKVAPMYRVVLGEDGEPTSESLQRIVPHWTVVRIRLRA
jgi:deazaflavin-dependent oxidoreductase (nitroreductase family)